MMTWQQPRLQPGDPFFQALAREIRCLTIEHFSDRVLDCLEQLYGPVPVRLTLSKCAAPVPGFDGVVAVERIRHGAR